MLLCVILTAYKCVVVCDTDSIYKCVVCDTDSIYKCVVVCVCDTDSIYKCVVCDTDSIIYKCVAVCDIDSIYKCVVVYNTDSMSVSHTTTHLLSVSHTHNTFVNAVSVTCACVCCSSRL